MMIFNGFMLPASTASTATASTGETTATRKT